MQTVLFNTKSRDHRTSIAAALRESDNTFIAVAFLKQSGLANLADELEAALKRGAQLTLVTGTDFWLTDPEALKRLYALKSNYSSLDLRIFRRSASATFHPKYYRFLTN